MKKIPVSDQSLHFLTVKTPDIVYSELSKLFHQSRPWDDILDSDGIVSVWKIGGGTEACATPTFKLVQGILYVVQYVDLVGPEEEEWSFSDVETYPDRVKKKIEKTIRKSSALRSLTVRFVDGESLARP